MKTKVTFTAKSKNSGKSFTITYDFNNTKEGWFVSELGKSITTKDMMANFPNFTTLANQEFRNQNVGVEFEIKKQTTNSDNFTHTTTLMFVDGKEVGSHISMLVFDFLSEGKYKIQSNFMTNKNFSDEAMKEITKQNSPENIW
jgi:hypothetical protein